MVTLEELGADVASGAVDTVLLVMTDMQGRLMGKRLHAPFFMSEVAAHGAEGCYYLLTVDVDMGTVQGFRMGSWDTGYGDFVFKPDMATLRKLPWLERTALVVADLEWQDGRPVAASPRQILRRQLDRLAERGWTANIGSELEFLLFRDSYDEARAKSYRDLEPANPYNVDYSIFGTTVVEDVLRPIRLGMAGAGISVEDSKGECNFGQHEVNFRYSDALTMADNHSIYKNGAKEIAWQHGAALSFIAKYNEREGNSCHIHCSLWSDDGSLFSDGDGHMTDLFRHFIAGQIAAGQELACFTAPNVNSYKRYASGSFAPTTLVWDTDNRTCALRVVGHGQGMRLENRSPGADCNPYLAFAAIIAAGLHGIDNELALEDAYSGNAYVAEGKPRLPASLHEALDLLESSALAREAFGDEVVDHYLHYGRTEQQAFESAVTDWELVRGFERM
ncbi:MAG TPA: glutamine synthetase family protein [Gaiellales bacterium]|jgi:glutamine synthetase|nr:glutamine synthetase family protein [Gaiellales bacterium]